MVKRDVNSVNLPATTVRKKTKKTTKKTGNATKKKMVSWVTARMGQSTYAMGGKDGEQETKHNSFEHVKNKNGVEQGKGYVPVRKVGEPRAKQGGKVMGPREKNKKKKYTMWVGGTRLSLHVGTE